MSTFGVVVEWCLRDLFGSLGVFLIVWLVSLMLVAVSSFRLAQPGWHNVPEHPGYKTATVYAFCAVLLGSGALWALSQYVNFIVMTNFGSDIQGLLAVVAIGAAILITLGTMRVFHRLGSKRLYVAKKVGGGKNV